MPERFDKFVLSIEKVGDVHRVRVVDSPRGESHVVAVPSAVDGASAVVGTVRGDRDLASVEGSRRRLEQIGEELFRAVFTGDVAAAYRASLDRVRRQGLGLRVHIHVDGAPEAARWPWEALRDPKSRAFLADHPDVPVVRGFGVKPEVSAASAPPRGPLRILGLLPGPRDSVALSGEEEWGLIQGHLADLLKESQAVAERVEPATLGELGRRLRHAPCDVLHIVAHGRAGGSGVAGELELENASGDPDWVTGTEVSRAFEGPQPPRLIVLSSCHGATSADGDALDGLAQHFLVRGVPAVIAMRAAISDAAAVEFASGLYRYLALGESVEAAMIEARRELALGEHRTEWPIPTLYLRDDHDDGSTQLLAVVDDAEPAPPSARSPVVKRAAVAAAAAGVAALGFFGLRSTAPPAEPAPVESAPVEPASAQIVEPAGVTAGVPRPSMEVDRCPAPDWLEDLEFVLVEPGELAIEGRVLKVEIPFCI
ncbi:MAG: CHAT domain-containing protein, partial [Acidobacteriota bacterium]